jgi:hypothetical protein
MHLENPCMCRFNRITYNAFSQIAVKVVMEHFLSGLRVKVLIIRILLGLLLTFLLTRFFFPDAGIVTKIALAGLLIFSAYVLEYIHRGRR